MSKAQAQKHRAVIRVAVINTRLPEIVSGGLFSFNIGGNMNRTLTRNLTAITTGLLLSACMNMPTNPSQITGAYTSGIKYDDYGCSKLGGELSSLARRENQLVTAQEQRLRSSQMQAFWWGFGQGDGVEASELANVRGETEAVRAAMESKGC